MRSQMFEYFTRGGEEMEGGVYADSVNYLNRKSVRSSYKVNVYR